MHEGAVAPARHKGRLRRLSGAPIVEAGAVAGYGPLFNAGLLHHEGVYHLFVRAVRDGYRSGGHSGPRFVDYVSDIVVFTSKDGSTYDFGYVLARGGAGDTYSFEDPRVQWVGHDDQRLVMTYTHLPAPESGGPWRIGGQHLQWEDDRFQLDASTEALLGPPGVEDKDAVVFTLADGRVGLIHRIHPNMQLALFDSLDHLWGAAPEYWDAHLAGLDTHTLLSPAPGALGIGAGAPPLRTEAGLLLFFHERRADGSYTINLALLDEHTGRVRSRLAEPLLEPELSWERQGDVNHVVFVQGAHLAGDDLYLTYGAADRCVGAAVASVAQLLDALAATGFVARAD